MSAADMTRVTWKRDWFPHLIGLTWCVVIANMVVSARTMADRDEAIRQRDEARAQSAVTRDALDVITDIESYRQMIDHTGASFCFSMKGDLTGCLWRKP